MNYKTKLLSTSERDISYAARLLADGEVVGIPTETVYGLAADAENEESVKKIFEAKGRPQDNPLIVHLASADDACKYAYVTPLFNKLAAAFMPGPITVILNKKDVISEVVTCGLDSVGIRVPLYDKARELIRRFTPGPLTLVVKRKPSVPSVAV